MKHFDKIHQHIHTVLEERGLHKSLSDIFKKHRILSSRFWFPISVCFYLLLHSFNFFSEFEQVFLQLAAPPSGSLEHFASLIISYIPVVFLSGLGTTLLAEYLPLYKLSQKKFFKKYFEKYFRKSTTIASSCDSVNYKEEMILKHAHDKELNLAMSSYYQYLLEFPFSIEAKKNIQIKRDKLLDIELDSEQYQKRFVKTVITFLQDFYYYSTCDIVVKNCYEKEVLDYTDSVLSSEQPDNGLEKELAEHLSDHCTPQKKSFKDML